MLNLIQWAHRHGVSDQAVAELRAEMGDVHYHTASNGAPGSEAAVQNAIRLEASRKGARLWRNNVGAYKTEEGGFIRYGLANDTKAMNATIKSSDLIGLRPVIIEPSMVGHTLGQFVAIEVKAPNWVYTGTKREEAQMKFIHLINSMGGFARFSREEGTL